VSAESRTIEEIRGEMASQRAQLQQALGDLRRGLGAKRKPIALLVSLVLTVLVAVVVARVVRRLVGD
jgi:hypothetical protein